MDNIFPKTLSCFLFLLAGCSLEHFGKPGIYHKLLDKHANEQFNSFLFPLAVLSGNPFNAFQAYSDSNIGDPENDQPIFKQN